MNLWVFSVLEDEQRRVKELLSGEMELFWKDILLLLQAAPPGSPLHDVAQLEYIIKNEILPQNFEDNDQKVTLTVLEFLFLEWISDILNEFLEFF